MTTEEVVDILGRIGDEALRAGDIIHRLRGLVQRRESEKVDCDARNLLEEIAPLASVDARMNEVDFRLLLPRAVPRIRADCVQIQQVVLNLIRNGIDAMAETDPEDRILEVRLALSAGSGLQVSVADRGCGISETSEVSLFEPFFSTKGSGLGLGLNISRSIILDHGGQLWFTRNPEGGTTFSFTLPISGEDTDER